MTNTSSTTPEEFDLNDWLSDAHLPEESVTVYKRADLQAELSDLKRRYEIERRTERDESSVGETSTPVADEYEARLKEFADSALTIYVRALLDDELKELAGKPDDIKDSEDAGFRILARTITAVRPANGERREVAWSAPMVKALHSKIGEAQMSLILQAYQTATKRLPNVDADFLHKSSGQESTRA